MEFRACVYAAAFWLGAAAATSPAAATDSSRDADIAAAEAIDRDIAKTYAGYGVAP
ncbi:MAG TPA: hypothetical protein VHX61_11040 [Rhizomicrobium sp.]|jgi:hypothetical protein|nr:hypothetical protein [Rhizomicrobium sp.]